MAEDRKFGFCFSDCRLDLKGFERRMDIFVKYPMYYVRDMYFGTEVVFVLGPKLLDFLQQSIPLTMNKKYFVCHITNFYFSAFIKRQSK